MTYLWGALDIEERELLRYWAGLGPSALAAVGAILADGGDTATIARQWVRNVEYYVGHPALRPGRAICPDVLRAAITAITGTDISK